MLKYCYRSIKSATVPLKFGHYIQNTKAITVPVNRVPIFYHPKRKYILKVGSFFLRLGMSLVLILFVYICTKKLHIENYRNKLAIVPLYNRNIRSQYIPKYGTVPTCQCFESVSGSSKSNLKDVSVKNVYGSGTLVPASYQSLMQEFRYLVPFF